MNNHILIQKLKNTVKNVTNFPLKYISDKILSVNRLIPFSLYPILLTTKFRDLPLGAVLIKVFAPSTFLAHLAPVFPKIQSCRQRFQEHIASRATLTTLTPFNIGRRITYQNRCGAITTS